jgi:hypothetical protein
VPGLKTRTAFVTDAAGKTVAVIKPNIVVGPVSILARSPRRVCGAAGWGSALAAQRSAGRACLWPRVPAAAQPHHAYFDTQRHPAPRPHHNTQRLQAVAHVIDGVLSPTKAAAPAAAAKVSTEAAPKPAAAAAPKAGTPGRKLLQVR